MGHMQRSRHSYKVPVNSVEEGMGPPLQMPRDMVCNSSDDHHWSVTCGSPGHETFGN